MSSNLFSKPFVKKFLAIAGPICCTIVAIFCSQFVIGLLMELILGDAFAQPKWMFVYYLISYTIALVLLIVLVPRLVRVATTKNELGVATSPTFVDIGLAPIGYVVYLILAWLATAAMSLLPWFNASEAQEVGFTGYLAGADRIFAMLAIVFIAPIAEELIMRGWLYGKLRSELPSRRGMILAIILTSLTFAVLHGQWNVGVTVFVLSVILCALREITGTIWSGMFLHILVNGVAFYLLYIML